MHGDEYRRFLYDIGVSVNLANNEPKKLPSLLDPPVKKVVRSEDIPMGPVRIPKKKRK